MIFAVICRCFLIVMRTGRSSLNDKYKTLSSVSLFVDSFLFEVFRPEIRQAFLLQDEPYWFGATTYWCLVFLYQFLTNEFVSASLQGFLSTQYMVNRFFFNDDDMQQQRATKLYPHPVALHHEMVTGKYAFETTIYIVFILWIIDVLYTLSVDSFFSLYMRIEFGFTFGKHQKSCPFAQKRKHSTQPCQSAQKESNGLKRRILTHRRNLLNLSRHIKVKKNRLSSLQTLLRTSSIRFENSCCHHNQVMIPLDIVTRMTGAVGKPSERCDIDKLALPLVLSETEQYKMDANPKGMCVIINNRDFSSPKLSRRDGTDKDVSKLKEFFKRCQFEVKVFVNQTDSDILEELKRISSQDHRPYDCFVCFILSHGQQECVYGTNGTPVSVAEIESFFSARQCRSLAKKPKLFFIQACQGGEEAQGINAEDTDHGGCWQNDVRASFLVHEHADFLTVFATPPGFIAYRNAKTGSEFISTLIDMLDKYPGHSLIDILTMITNVMDKGAGRKQIPMFKSTLRKRVVIN